MKKQRDIKFLAWDNLTKQIICKGFHVIGEFTLFHELDVFICEHPGEAKSSLERYGDIEIYEHACLQDKNGTDIYEEDILGIPNNAGEIEKYRVVFWNGTWSVQEL